MSSVLTKPLYDFSKKPLLFSCGFLIFFLLAAATANASAMRWAVNLTSDLIYEDAHNAAKHLKAEGYNAYVTEATVKGQRYYRLRIGFFNTKKEAQAQSALISAKFNVQDAWVVRVSDEEAARHTVERPLKPDDKRAAQSKTEHESARSTKPAPPPLNTQQPQAASTAPSSPQPQTTPTEQIAPPQKKTVADEKSASTTPQPAPVMPMADGDIHINIYKDFSLVSSGWPMGLSTGQTDADGLTTVPFEAFKREPAYSSAKPLYGYFSIGNSNDRKISFVLDKVEQPQWELYVDKNNNEDLTDDGPAIKNQGTLKMSGKVTLGADVILLDGTTRRTPYQLWFFINDSGPHFYATCHYAGQIEIGPDVYEAVAFEESHHDGLFKESGVCVDLDKDGKCSHERELFKDGAILSHKSGKYTFRLDYP